MRYKTVADFGSYAVVEPTEPVKKVNKIEVIDIRRQPVEKLSSKSHKRKDDREEIISAIFAGVVPVLMVALMIITWIIFGY